MDDLCPKLLEAFSNPEICRLVERTLSEDLQTFGVDAPDELAALTMEKLSKAGRDYPTVARDIALELFPTWRTGRVKEKYHHYNWKVERAGSARQAAPFVQGEKIIDVGGGPGTFADELLKALPEKKLNITITDLEDYRKPSVKSNPRISYVQVAEGQPLPFADRQFDTGALLYVLHHVRADRQEFLKEVGRVIRGSLIIFEDVWVNTSNGVPKGEYETARSLEADFMALDQKGQLLFIAAIDYVCNYCASQALSMPMPCEYYEFSEFERFLSEAFPGAEVMKRYHGIYKTKCFPNPEAMYVVRFNHA